jgi:hypothetical protein
MRQFEVFLNHYEPEFAAGITRDSSATGSERARDRAYRPAT